ncbi:hypothetical protein [Streptomyces sp. NBC_01244]|uniref:hypothetical protein n=1 Tax=Streptomyces sp. NBC_01244 TaxID=2903797 RepID=UPI002E104EAB|nr:hypothetical protein OG247_38740 [Streptomyces sp. NBC_01244]
MQPIRARHRASALAAGVVAVLLLVCGGLFTHPASAGDAAGTRMAGAPPNGSPAMAGMAGMAGAEMAGMAATAGMGEAPVTAGTPAMATAPESGAGAGTDGDCSASGQDCPLASAYAPTVQAGPAGDLAGCAIWGTRSVADGHPRPVPPPERSRPRAPDLDSLCVSRT